MKQMGPESMFVEFLTWILSVNPYMLFRKFEFSKIFLRERLFFYYYR